MKFNKIIRTILFYVIYIVAAVIWQDFEPGGPCTPGPGAMLLLALFPVSIFLFLRSIFKYYINPEKERIYCMAIHLLVFFGFMILIRIGMA